MSRTAAPRRSTQARRARGGTLIVGMLLLLLMSAVSLTSLKAIRTDERLAGNLQDRYLAFQAAEAALRAAEAILEQPALPSFQTTRGLYRFQDANVPDPFELTEANAQVYDLFTQAQTGITPRPIPPRFIVEQMEAGIEEGGSLVVGTRYVGDRRNSYRITALGFGGSATTRVVLQSTFRR